MAITRPILKLQPAYLQMSLTSYVIGVALHKDMYVDLNDIYRIMIMKMMMILTMKTDSQATG